MKGRGAQITLLFADIRGFSQISEKLDPALTMTWIQDTMETLSQCVLDCDGVLVDYIGDELMAMWRAPIAQPNHANLACQAAQKMILTLPEINQRWEDQLQTQVGLGIGLNSGIAQVGNTGSRLKFKYGPLGGTVNIASRVQGAIKYFGAECLLTETTLSAMEPKPATRCLARVRVVNIEQPLDLHEIKSPPPDWSDCCQRYAEALEALEQQDLTSAGKLTQLLVADFPNDQAFTCLAGRVADANRQGAVSDTGIWNLPGK